MEFVGSFGRSLKILGNKTSESMILDGAGEVCG